MKITNFIPKTLTSFTTIVGAVVLSGCTPTPAPALVQHLVYAVVYGVVLLVLFNFVEQMVNKYNNLLRVNEGLTVIDKAEGKHQKINFQKKELLPYEICIGTYYPCVIGHKPIEPKQIMT
jgi:hypothetical protein